MAEITIIIGETQDLIEQFIAIREQSESICKPLEIEDYVVQPIADVSPPKWHLGHATWFFETFILQPHFKGYNVYNSNYNYVFNSYYETVGARVVRTDRGNLSRPSVDEVYDYRKYVDEQMIAFLQSEDVTSEVAKMVELGLHHEQQHQELLYYDIKYILGHNPLFPVYSEMSIFEKGVPTSNHFVRFSEGIYEIGFNDKGFCFDNELGRHKQYLGAFEIATNLVTNSDYLQFIEAGGYTDFRYWHSQGWEWVQEQKIKAPLYWHYIEDQWMYYTLNGLKEINLAESLCHVSFYEAAAFAAWKGLRLPTEFEWEVASRSLNWGERWEWTSSAYLPYPNYTKEVGAIGEYNGKFMVNQMVLRGASVVTSKGHSRSTYRNFFHPNKRWQFSGIRLAK